MDSTTPRSAQASSLKKVSPSTSAGEPRRARASRPFGFESRQWSIHVRAFAVAILATFVYLGCAASSSKSEGKGLMPPFELPLLEGGTLTSQALVGKVHVINFFATWCGPCKMELPDLNRFYQRQDPNKVAMFGIAAGDEHRLDVRRFLDEQQVRFPVAVQGEMLLAQIGSTGLPTTVVLDASGHVQHIVKGVITDEQLTSWVTELTSQPPSHVE